jgi:hypothetical protein
MYSNSVLQYAPEPRQTLKQLCGLRAKKMLWERLSLSNFTVPPSRIFNRIDWQSS